MANLNGTGKTVLASMIIEEVRKRQISAGSSYPASTTPTIQYAYFYCRHGNQKKDNYLSIIGALIVQLAQQNRDSELSLLLYDTIIRSDDAHLSSRGEAEVLLKCVLEGSSASFIYLIIDGLDECATARDITDVIQTISKITEPLNVTSSGAFRLFFTSTDDNVIRKQLPKAVKLKIKPKDNEQDIKHYTTCWSSKIQQKFGLSDDERQAIESIVMFKTNGLYALPISTLKVVADL